MSTANEGYVVLKETMTATGTIIENRFVTMDGIHATAAGQADGVSNENAVAEGVLPVVTIGVFPVLAGAAIVLGDEIEVGVDGKAVPIALGVAVGRARESAAIDVLCNISIYNN